MQSESTFDTSAVSGNKHQLNPENWVSLYSDFLFRYAFSRLNDEEQAHDLVQETFLAALERADSFRGDSSERTWLSAIIKHKIIDIYRYRARSYKARDEQGNPINEEEFFDQELNHWKKEHWPAPFKCNGQDPLNDEEFMNVLQQCLQKLPPLWMSVFIMKHMDDEKTGDICKDLRLSTSNYWVIIHRAKINLRSCLQKNWI